jgi:phosphatidylserine decarboxylase
MWRKKIWLWAQQLAPQHSLSRFAGWVATCESPFIKDRIIRWFIQRYGVDMSIAKRPDPADYQHFNDFFTRQLRENARPLDKQPKTLLSPVDGTIAQIGQIENSTLIQAKGHHYTLSHLLADPKPDACFEGGLYTTVYLAPRDYHRIHMPIAGRLTMMRYVPGQLFSVNQATAADIPNLFARNERVICQFDTEFGPIILVLVGAMLVASIATEWAGIVAPSRSPLVQSWYYQNPSFPGIYFDQGADIAHFRLGSTVIVILPKDTATWHAQCVLNSPLKMGQVLANFK